MNRHEIYILTRNLMTHGGIAIVFFSAGMMMVENNNSHKFITKVQKTDVQEYLLQKGMATRSDFSEVAQVAVDRKTMDIIKENRELILKDRNSKIVIKSPYNLVP